MSQYAESVNILRGLFPERSHAEISAALELVSGDIELAADSLSSEVSTLSIQPETIQKNKPSSKSNRSPAPRQSNKGWSSQSKSWANNQPNSPVPKIKYAAPKTSSARDKYIPVTQDILPSSHDPASAPNKQKSSSAKEQLDVPLEPGRDEIDDLYTQERKEALAVRKLRDKAKKRAQKAYVNGDDISARQYTLEAQKLSAQLETLQQEASERIFIANNPIDHSLGIKALLKLDLHGLHSEEALSFFCKRFNQISALLSQAEDPSLKQVWLSVITGRGAHQSGNSVIRPTIEMFLSKSGLKYEARSAGSFDVQIAPNQVISTDTI